MKAIHQLRGLISNLFAIDFAARNEEALLEKEFSIIARYQEPILSVTRPLSSNWLR